MIVLLWCLMALHALSGISVRLVSPSLNKWRLEGWGVRHHHSFHLSCLVYFGDFVSYYTMIIWIRGVRLLSLIYMLKPLVGIRDPLKFFSRIRSDLSVTTKMLPLMAIYVFTSFLVSILRTYI